MDFFDNANSDFQMLKHLLGLQTKYRDGKFSDRESENVRVAEPAYPGLREFEDYYGDGDYAPKKRQFKPVGWRPPSKVGGRLFENDGVGPNDVRFELMKYLGMK